MILYDNVPINFLRDFLGYFTSHGAKSVSYHRTVIACLRRYLPFDYFRRKKKNLVLISFHFSPLLFYTEEKKTRLVESSDIDIINPSSAVNRATPVFFTSGLFYKRSRAICKSNGGL